MAKKFLLLSLSIVFFFISEAQKDFPINPSTGLVSINNVMVLSGRSKKSLKETAELFVKSYSDNINPATIKDNNDKIKMPSFGAKKTLDEDSVLAFDCNYSAVDLKRMIMETISFKMLFYLKDNKCKYDLTNFSYLYVVAPTGVPSQVSGKFENSRPDQKASARLMKQWEEGKLKGIKYSQIVAKEMEEFFKRNEKSQFDF